MSTLTLPNKRGESKVIQHVDDLPFAKLLTPSRNSTVIKKTNGQHFRVITVVKIPPKPDALPKERKVKNRYLLEPIYRADGDTNISVEQEDMNEVNWTLKV